MPLLTHVCLTKTPYESKSILTLGHTIFDCGFDSRFQQSTGYRQEDRELQGNLIILHLMVFFTAPFVSLDRHKEQLHNGDTHSLTFRN